jgi:hypothetical protein
MPSYRVGQEASENEKPFLVLPDQPGDAESYFAIVEPAPTG